MPACPRVPESCATACERSNANNDAVIRRLSDATRSVRVKARIGENRNRFSAAGVAQVIDPTGDRARCILRYPVMWQTRWRLEVSMPSRLKSLLVFIAVFFLFNALPAKAQNLQQLQQYQQLQQQEQDRRQANPEATPSFEPSGQTICAGNIPPEGTIITATGNSIDCGGSCRARRIQPLHGHIMVICSQQPIPDNYEIQSVTTTPSCNCIGEEDNAYVFAPSPEP